VETCTTCTLQHKQACMHDMHVATLHRAPTACTHPFAQACMHTSTCASKCATPTHMNTGAELEGGCRGQAQTEEKKALEHLEERRGEKGGQVSCNSRRTTIRPPPPPSFLAARVLWLQGSASCKRAPVAQQSDVETGPRHLRFLHGLVEHTTLC